MGLAATLGLGWIAVNRSGVPGPAPQVQEGAADVAAPPSAPAPQKVLAQTAATEPPSSARVSEKEEGTEARAEEAFKSALMAAEQGLPAAQMKLGQSYKNGVGVAQNMAEALRWFQRAASGGLESASYEVAWCLLNGGKNIEDHGKAVTLLHPLAQKGNPDAQFLMGEACFGGKGGQRSDTAAVQWWELAAEQGHSEAQNRLGLAYQRGIGVMPDMEKAALWFRKAGERQEGDLTPREKLGNDRLLAGLAAGTARAAAAAPPQQHLPTDNRLTSGELLTDRFRGFGGKGQLILENGLVDDAYVKVVGGRKLWASFYLRGGGKFTFDHVPDGTYQVIYCTGFDWDPKARDFGRDQHAMRHERKLDFTTMRTMEKTQTVVSIPIFTLTLQAVPRADAPTSDIPLEEFNSF